MDQMSSKKATGSKKVNTDSSRSSLASTLERADSKLDKASLPTSLLRNEHARM